MKQARPTPPPPIIHLVFFLSGFAALVYEISWSRQIGLLFGHTVYAASIVLASYFLGMAAGYLAGARWCSRLHPLRGYGYAEIAVAIWALFVPTVLSVVESQFIGAMSNSNPLIQLIIRAIFGLTIIFPATFALGLTLPMMAEWLSPRHGIDIGRVSLAYAANTLGALAGAVVTPVYLLSNAGVARSSYIAAGISALCAALAILISTRRSEAIDQAPSESPKSDPGSKLTMQWTFIAALSGGVTLGLQVAYTRMFALVFHNSTYTFGTIVAVFLLSLAISAFIVSRLHQRISAESIIGWASCLGAITLSISVLIFLDRTRLEFFDEGTTFGEHMTAAYLLVLSVVAIPVLLLGLVLPAVWSAVDAQAGAGRVVGRLTAANTFAAAAGSLLIAFVIIPLLGLWWSFALLAILAYLPAIWLWWIAGKRTHCIASFVAVMLLAGISVGTGLSARTLPEGTQVKILKQWQSPYGWIDVVGVPSDNFLALRENIHYQHGDTGLSKDREHRQGHIPLLIHPDPEDVLYLGLGTGLTAGSAVVHPDIESIDIVELIPEVVEAAALFGDYNHQLLNDERVNVHIDDARHFLLASNRKYDVIISDLFVPWQSQSGYLYTVDHYEVIRDRLQEDGLFCQWIGFFQIGQSEFEMIANSFASVFPHTSLWWGRVQAHQGMICLIGSNHPLEVDSDHVAARIAQTFPGGARDPYLSSPESVLRLYIGDWSQNPSAILNRDEWPRLEFSMPITYRNQGLLKRKAFVDYFDQVLTKLPDGKTRFRSKDPNQLESLNRKHQLQRAVMTRPPRGS